MSVFVLDARKRPLMPCSEKRAKLLLQRGRARVARRYPFTIRLVDVRVEDCALQPVRIKLDPGSRTTGVAVVRDAGGSAGRKRQVLHSFKPCRRVLIHSTEGRAFLPMHKCRGFSRAKSMNHHVDMPAQEAKDGPNAVEPSLSADECETVSSASHAAPGGNPEDWHWVNPPEAELAGDAHEWDALTKHLSGPCTSPVGPGQSNTTAPILRDPLFPPPVGHVVAGSNDSVND